VTGAYYRTKVTVPGVDGTKDLYMLSATYAFSKRTNLYALVDHAKYKDGANTVFLPTATNQDKQTGFSVGINHLF
jgi:predicted porin